MIRCVCKLIEVSAGSCLRYSVFLFLLSGNNGGLPENRENWRRLVLTYLNYSHEALQMLILQKCVIMCVVKFSCNLCLLNNLMVIKLFFF